MLKNSRGSTTTGPCYKCGTTTKERLPLVVIDEISKDLKDIISCCYDCWNFKGNKTFFEAKQAWEGKKQVEPEDDKKWSAW